jgi:hypothetical protein
MTKLKHLSVFIFTLFTLSACLPIPIDDLTGGDNNGDNSGGDNNGGDNSGGQTDGDIVLAKAFATELSGFMAPVLEVQTPVEEFAMQLQEDVEAIDGEKAEAFFQAIAATAMLTGYVLEGAMTYDEQTDELTAIDWSSMSTQNLSDVLNEMEDCDAVDADCSDLPTLTGTIAYYIDGAEEGLTVDGTASWTQSGEVYDEVNDSYSEVDLFDVVIDVTFDLALPSLQASDGAYSVSLKSLEVTAAYDGESVTATSLTAVTASLNATFGNQYSTFVSAVNDEPEPTMVSLVLDDAELIMQDTLTLGGGIDLAISEADDGTASVVVDSYGSFENSVGQSVEATMELAFGYSEDYTETGNDWTETEEFVIDVAATVAFQLEDTAAPTIYASLDFAGDFSNTETEASGTWSDEFSADFDGSIQLDVGDASWALGVDALVSGEGSEVQGEEYCVSGHQYDVNTGELIACDQYDYDYDYEGTGEGLFVISDASVTDKAVSMQIDVNDEIEFDESSFVIGSFVVDDESYADVVVYAPVWNEVTDEMTSGAQIVAEFSDGTDIVLLSSDDFEEVIATIEDNSLFAEEEF